MITEERNPRTLDFDALDTLSMITLIHEEDQEVSQAVNRALPQISRAVEGIVSRLSSGGRLFYVGAGTSGRLGVLDAVECVPTFGIDPQLVQGVLAGGYEACYRAVETAEDDAEKGVDDLGARELRAADAVVGITASGRTPYTLAAVEFARRIGAFSVGISCNTRTPLSQSAEVVIEAVVGPEVIAGSTRMKAGTAQKLILNMISSVTFTRLGYVYGNLMVNVRPTNEKLFRRAVGIVAEAGGVDAISAEAALKQTGEVRSAILMLRLGCSPERAGELAHSSRSLRELLHPHPKKTQNE